MKKLIVGNQYTIDNTEMYLECAGDDCEGYTCCMCGKELKRGYCFTDKKDNPTIREVYGNECIKKVLSK